MSGTRTSRFGRYPTFASFVTRVAFVPRLLLVVALGSERRHADITPGRGRAASNMPLPPCQQGMHVCHPQHHNKTYHPNNSRLYYILLYLALFSSSPYPTFPLPPPPSSFSPSFVFSARCLVRCLWSNPIRNSSRAPPHLLAAFPSTLVKADSENTHTQCRL